MNSWKLYSASTKDIIEAMLADLELAKTSVDLEQYSLWDDNVGKRFLKLFERKNKEGVKIRLICDAFGSFPLFASNYVSKLQEQGIEIVKFNPIRPWSFFSFFYRNHKKTMIIDSKISWIGGVGLKNKFFDFRDTQLRLEGKIAEEMQRGFDHLWSIAQEGNFKKQLRRMEMEQSNENFHILTNGPAVHQKEVLNWLQAKISSAEKNIYITTPYFIPSKDLLSSLANKAKKGVDVRILYRGKNDDNLSGLSAASYFHQALNSGIRIYKYMPQILHVKTITIDDKYASVGSTNLNSLSLRLSYEANAASIDPEFAIRIRNDFLNDLKSAQEVMLADWKKRSILIKLVEILTWPLHGYL